MWGASTSQVTLQFGDSASLAAKLGTQVLCDCHILLVPATFQVVAQRCLHLIFGTGEQFLVSASLVLPALSYLILLFCVSLSKGWGCLKTLEC